VVGLTLALIIVPPALGLSWYLGIVFFLLAALALALLIMAKVAGKL